MFVQLKGVVDLIRTGITDLRNFQSAKAREEAVLDVLRIYFVLKDCVDEGEMLVSDAQPNPIEKLAQMTPEEALATIERWDAIIRRQGIRLYQLQGALIGQDHIAVINPALKDRLTVAVGSKMDRAVTLHGIGAALFYKSMFPVANTSEEKARYISLMAGEKDETLNMSRICAEIQSLKKSLGQYRSVVERMVSNAELLQLSQRARRETEMSNEV